MAKILILGNSGSGKSTFTICLAKKLNIEYLHLDTLVYRHDWNIPEYNQMEQIVDNLIDKDDWIMDGNFINNALSRFEKCDTIYFLDINRFTCLYSVLKRNKKYKGKKRASRSDLIDEKITKEYLKWVFIDFYKTSRITIKNFIKNHPEKKVIVFKSRKQVNKYIKENLI